MQACFPCPPSQILARIWSFGWTPQNRQNFSTLNSATGGSRRSVMSHSLRALIELQNRAVQRRPDKAVPTRVRALSGLYEASQRRPTFVFIGFPSSIARHHTRHLLSRRHVLSRAFYLFPSIHQNNRPRCNLWRDPTAEVRFLLLLCSLASE